MPLGWLKHWANLSDSLSVCCHQSCILRAEVHQANKWKITTEIHTNNKKMKTRKMRNTSNSKGSGSKIENRRHFFPSHSTPAARACRRASYKLQRDPYVFTKRSKPSQWTWLLWPEIPSKTRRVSNRRLRSSLLWKTTASRNKCKEWLFGAQIVQN